MPDAIEKHEAIPVVILAAGASSRLGEPKQLLRYEGQTLIRRAVIAALADGSRPVIIVLGANADRLRPELDWVSVHIVENPDWQTGMASSLRVGLDALERFAPPTSALFMLSDQPLVTAPVLARLVTAYRTSPLPIAAAEYGDTVGVPAIFAREMFPLLRKLTGDMGARKVISAQMPNVTRVPMPEAALDIDTPEDRRTLAQVYF